MFKKDSVNNDEVEPSLDEIYNECVARYDEVVKVDTSFVDDGKNVEVHFKHYCLRDSAVRVPAEYTALFKMDSFVTHNYASSLKIKVDEKLVLDTIIRKEIFKDSVYDLLSEHGVLLFPYVDFPKNEGVVVGYSYSIPLTDVGRGVKFYYSWEK